MTENRIWELLKIEPTMDEQSIQSAYRTLLPTVNPEDDAEGFRNLREAYEAALKLISEKQQESREQEKNRENPEDLSDIDRFMEKVEVLYESIPGRCEVSAWNELLNEPVCQALDTSLEVREKVLAYLMDHFYLPSEVFRRLDKEFHFVEEQETLLEMFPREFLAYLERQVKNDNFFPYELLEVVSVRDEKDDADAYIRTYFDIKNALDQEQTEGVQEKIKQLSDASIRHPYLNVEIMRFNMLNGRKEEAGELAEKLMQKWDNDDYVVFQCAQVWFELEQTQKAFEAWNSLLEKNPQHYGAKFGLALYYQREGNAEKAKEATVDLLERNGQDEKMNEVMHWANEILIKNYQEKFEKDPDNVGDALEMGWCLFQNERDEDTIALLDRIHPDDKEHERDYCNLRGRCLYNMKRFEEAIPFLKKWLLIMDELVAAGQGGKKTRRRGYAAFLLAMSYEELALQTEDGEKVTNQMEAEDFFKLSIANEENDYARLSYENNLAVFYNECRKYEKAVDVCDRILEVDSGYYPAYLQRQKAFFELKNAQGVVDDYHAAVEIVPNYFVPYVLAAKVFFIFNQYEDVKDVVTRAKEAGAWSCALALYEIKAGRMLAESEKERVSVLALADELEFHRNELEDDVEDWSELYAERAILCLDTRNYEEGLEKIEKAIELNPSKHYYEWIRADLIKAQGKLEEAMKLYQTLELKIPDNPGINYDMARCYINMGDEANAVIQFEKTLEKDPEHRRVNNELMNIYQRRYNQTYQKKYYVMAMEHADKQLQNLDNSYYRIERAILRLDGYETAAALEDLEESLKTEPDNLYSYNNIGFAYRLEQKWDLAIENFRKAAELMDTPETVLPYSNLADCYEIIGEYDKAIQCLEKNKSMFPKNLSVYTDMGFVFIKMEQYEKAIECFEKFCELSEGDCVREKGWIARSYEKLNQNKMAEKCLLDAAKDNPLKGSLTCMVFYKDVKRDYRKAWKYLKKVEKICAWHGETLSGSDYLNMAETCYLCEKWKKAKEHAESALEQFLKSGVSLEEYMSYPNKGPLNRCQIGRYYHYCGDLEKAEELFTSATSMKLCCDCKQRQCQDVYCYLGRLYEAMGDYDKALQSFLKVQEICPTDSELPAALEAISKKRK